MTTDSRSALEQQRRLLVLLWCGMAGSLVIYLLIPRFIGASGPVSSWEIIRPVLWVLALANAGFLWWWNGRFLSKEAALKNPEMFQRSNESQPASNYTAKKIVALALAEAIAVYGLILAILGGSAGDQYLMTLLSALSFVYLYPSAGFFEDVARELEGRGVR